MLPAGVIERIDRENQVVHVNRSRHDIKNVPEYDEDRHEDENYRTGLGDYYGGRNVAGYAHRRAADYPSFSRLAQKPMRRCRPTSQRVRVSGRERPLKVEFRFQSGEEDVWA